MKPSLILCSFGSILVSLTTLATGLVCFAADTQLNTGFDGPSGADTGWFPLDPNSAVGPRHVMDVANGIYRIYNKAGTLVASGGIDSLWSSSFPGTATIDPNVTFDDLAQRFVLQATGSGSDITNSYVAVSNTSDPTQGFTEVHRLPFPGQYDGGKVGFNADVYVLVGSPGTAIIDKASLLDSNNATFTVYYQTTTSYGRPARMHGATPGSPMYFTAASGGQIRVTRATGLTTASPTFTSYNIAGSSGCTDPATPAWRNNSIVTANTGAMYWWQVDTSTTTPTLVQQGLQSPQPGFTTAYGSANIAPNGDMGMTWMELSASTTPLPVNMWIAWRAAADPLNSMRPSVLAKSSGSVVQANSRHGDFSSTVCDISTNGTTLNTFWSCNGYLRSPGGEAEWNQNFGGTPLMPPAVAVQPQNVTVTEGIPFAVSITCTGAQPFVYQWLKDGVNISGATTNPFSIAQSAATDGGNYTVIVANNEGSVTSAVAVVTVIPAHDGVWASAAGGSWTNPANWSGGVVATGIGKTANFGTLNLTASPTVTLDNARTIGHLVFGDTTPSHNWTLSTGSAGPLTLDILTGAPTVTVSNQAATISAVVAGTEGMVKLGAGTLALSSQATYTGNTTVNGGILDLTGGGGSSGTIRGTVLVNTGATLRLSTGDGTGYAGGASAVTTINLVGGTLNINTTANQTLGSATINLTGGAITGLTGGNLDFFGGSSALNVLGSPTTSTISGVPLSPVRQGNTTFNVAAGTAPSGVDLDISSVLRNSPNGDAASAILIKTGTGVMRLTATNTLVRPVQVNAGTLLLGPSGSLASTSVNVASGATLAGTGLLKGAVTNQAGSILSPGFNGIGTLTVSNILTLQGTVLAEINRTAGTADKLQGITTVNYGGALVVSNLAGTLTTNDTFTLFSATTYSGNFARITLPPLGAGLAWDVSSLSVNGSAKVIEFSGGSPATNVPTSVAATPVSTSQINLTWSPTPEATSYVVSRGGTPVATVFGTSFADTGLPMGTPYCYTVAGLNSSGSSAASPSVCATTFLLGGTLTWDANLGSSGAQDGNGVWNNSNTNWQYGGNNLAWNNSNLASFGVNATTNCTVTLSNDVAPSGIIFNATGGGTYTLTGASAILLTNTITFTANRSANISASINGPGTLLCTGAPSATLTVSAQNNYSGGTVVNGGRLAATGGGWYTTRSIGTGALTISNGATAQFTQAHGFGYGPGGYGVTINNATLQFDQEQYVSGLDMAGGAVTGAGEIRTTGTIYNFLGAATNSLITCGVNMVSAGTFNVADGPAAVDLLLAGYISNTSTLTKSGPGLLRYTGTQSGTGATTITAGTLQVDGVLNTGTVTLQNTATLSGTGTITGPVNQLVGGLLAPGGASIGTLSISNTLNLSGDTFFRISKTGGTRTNDQVRGMTAVTFTDTALFVTNITSDTNQLVAGDTFRLFAPVAGAPSAGEVMEFFLPPLPPGLAWDVSTLEVDGTLRVAPATFTLVYTAGPNGTLTGTLNQTVNYGANGTAITAIPNPSCFFVNWSDGRTQNPRTDLQVTNNISVLANFAVTAVPVVTNANLAANRTSFTVAGSGSPNAAYELLAATNVPAAAWLPVLTNYANPNGVFTFTDPAASNHLHRFYRVRSH